MADGELPDWDRIVERHGKRVFRVALRILGAVQDAEDVCQDVFTEAFRLHQAGPVQSWTGLLVRLATLRSIDRLRRKQPFVELRECDRMSTVEPFHEVAATELAHWLRKAIAQLPDRRVKCDDVTMAVFCHKPPGAANYRVIYGDLSVKEQNATPESLKGVPVSMGTPVADWMREILKAPKVQPAAPPVPPTKPRVMTPPNESSPH